MKKLLLILIPILVAAENKSFDLKVNRLMDYYPVIVVPELNVMNEFDRYTIKYQDITIVAEFGKAEKLWVFEFTTRGEPEVKGIYDPMAKKCYRSISNKTAERIIAVTSGFKKNP